MLAQMNQIIIEGDFLHFTSQKGLIPMSIEIENKNAHQSVNVGVVIESPNMAKIALSLRKGDGVRIVGRLGLLPCGRKLMVFCEHIEIKPKRVQTVEY